jgi:hypothetical protein
LSNKKRFCKIASPILQNCALLPIVYLLNTVYQEIMNLPIIAESQGIISEKARHVL